MRKILVVMCSLWCLVGLTSCMMDMQKAINKGNLAAVESAILKGEDVNKKDEDGDTPLIKAAKYGDFGIVLALVKNGADIKARNDDGHDALLALSDYSMQAPSKAAKGETVSNPVGVTLEGHLKIAGYLIDRGADVNAKANDGATPLILASRLNKRELVELLLSKGADVNAADKDGRTALIAAAMKGYDEVVCPLKRKGALMDAKDKAGNTALQYAEKSGSELLIQRLKNPCPEESGPQKGEDGSGKGADAKTQKELELAQLIAALRNEDPYVRKEAARKLGELKDARATIPLVGAMKDQDPYVRRRAAFSLGSMQDIRAIEILIKGLDDDDPFVQKYAIESLEKTTGQRLGSDPKKWREWWARQIRN